MIYRVNFLLRLNDGTRVTSPVMTENTSPLGALKSALARWSPPDFFINEGDVYGINIREIRPRGSKRNV